MPPAIITKTIKTKKIKHHQKIKRKAPKEKGGDEGRSVATD